MLDDMIRHLARGVLPGEKKEQETPFVTHG
jgi:hypothetical protein